jgi:AraC-like DNA-binding protein
VQLLVVTSGQALLIDEGGRGLPVEAALIPAGVPHALHAPDASGVMVYLDPAGRHARALTVRLAQNAAGSVPRQADEWQAAARPARLALAGVAAETLAAEILTAGIPAGVRAVEALAELPEPRPSSGAPQRALALLPGLVAAGGPIRLDRVAAEVGLSPGRLRHLFTAQLGLPFTACVRWARLHAAMQVVRAGGTLTQAAHAAGFADSAHLTRVFHAMFGLAPSAAARNLDWQ